MGVFSRAGLLFIALALLIPQCVSAIHFEGELPDLLIQSYSHSPAVTGGVVVWTIDIKNEGAASSGPFTVKISCPGFDASKQVESIPIGGATKVSPEFIFPNAGNFNCDIILDSNNEVTESNEGNNQATDSVSVSQPTPSPSPSPSPSPTAAPDLTFAYYELTPTKSKAGELLELKFAVKNQGTGDAGAFDLTVAWSDGTEKLISVGGLSAGGMQSFAVKKTFASHGSFTFTIWIDSFKAVVESNEANNNAGGSVEVSEAAQACPTKLDAFYDKPVYKTGEKATLTFKVLDANGNPKPNTEVIVVVELNGAPHGQTSYYTSSDGSYSSTSDIPPSATPGTYKFYFYTHVPECNSVGSYVTIQVTSDASPSPTPIPQQPCACTEVRAPVCGVNGKTYGSPCQAKCVGMAIAYEGVCGQPCPFDCCENEPVYLDKPCSAYTCASCEPASQSCVAGCKRDQCVEHKCQTPEPTVAPQFCSYPNECLTKRESIDRNCKPVSAICSQQMCARAQSAVPVTERASVNYRKARWTCCDGYTVEEGGETSCKSVEVWRKYAEESCIGRCTGSKCGACSFSVSIECGQQQTAVQAMAAGAITGFAVEAIIKPTTPAEPACIAEPRQCYYCPQQPQSCEASCKESCASRDGDCFKRCIETVCKPPKPATQSVPLHLNKGWNLFAAPLANAGNIELIGEVINREEVIEKCGFSSAPRIFYYDPLQSKYVKLEGNPKVGVGYWINMRQECTLKISGVDFNVDGKILDAGWNSISGPSREVQFDEIKGNCQAASGPWEYLTEAKKYQKTNLLKPGTGYLLKVPSKCQLAQYIESELPPALPVETTQQTETTQPIVSPTVAGGG